MSEKKFMVLVVQYERKNEESIERIVGDMTRHISTQSGKIHRVYQGSDERTVSALEKVLKLTG